MLAECTDHGLVNYIDNKAKCRHLKKFTCIGTLRQVFIRVYKLLIRSLMLVFRPSFVNCFPSDLLSGSSLPPPPLPCVNKYYIVYTFAMCKLGGGVYRVLGLGQISTCRKVPLQVIFYR
jgi:hypothetical protein